MVRKSYGKMRGTRKKMAAKPKTITRYLATFSVGEMVHIDYASQRIPHPRFKGLTGKVIGIRGASYIVAVKDGNAAKQLMLRPEHLKR
ncbi:MAG: 50S ribosomal protein L21e [Candidatus Aenigmarchaeota archaeon]|nr:50S ribosomal protein L21e [Candidatus Aenigmarchaeota archaeon]